MQSPSDNEVLQPHNELSDIEFARQFENLNLNPEWFSHEAHLRLAWVYSYIYDIEKAINKYRSGIRSFDAKYGDGTKYHETITIFMLNLIYSREKESISVTFDQFRKKNQDLFKSNKVLLSKYYSFDVLQNRKAKEDYIEPDLKKII